MSGTDFCSRRHFRWSAATAGCGLWALRVPLEPRLPGYPDMFSLAQAHNAFDDDGNLVDERLRGRFESARRVLPRLANG